MTHEGLIDDVNYVCLTIDRRQKMQRSRCILKAFKNYKILQKFDNWKCVWFIYYALSFNVQCMQIIHNTYNYWNGIKWSTAKLSWWPVDGLALHIPSARNKRTHIRKTKHSTCLKRISSQLRRPVRRDEVTLCNAIVAQAGPTRKKTPHMTSSMHKWGSCKPFFLYW
jgi:hypothetical protein